MQVIVRSSEWSAWWRLAGGRPPGHRWRAVGGGGLVTVRILLVDDEPLLRLGFRFVLDDLGLHLVPLRVRQRRFRLVFPGEHDPLLARHLDGVLRGGRAGDDAVVVIGEQLHFLLRLTAAS